MSQEDSRAIEIELDAVVVGAGFAGLYMLHRLRGLGLSVRVFEAGGGVGGTWYWNRYPGARCDIESMEYSYQFSEELQQEWEWKERYAPQAEILEYANHVADRFDLRRDIQFDTRVESAHFDEAASRWSVKTSQGQHVSSQFCIMATGCLSSANMPDFPGLESFRGATYHTGRWPHEGVDFTGKRVGVIGTGSSAIQSIPEIAKQATHLTVFQRTPSYSVPAHNAALSPEEEARVKADYPAFRERNSQMPFGAFADLEDRPEEALQDSPAERQKTYEEGWRRGGLTFLACYKDLLFNKEANDTAAEFVRKKIQAAVHDPETARKLTPDQVLGCKRLCADTNYFETYNLEHVELVDVSDEPIECLTPAGLRVDNREYELDAIVFATGFDAMTGALLSIDIRGENGLALTEKWSAGPRTYLGLMTAGFPNLFIVTGPGSPSVLANMVPAIEQHVNWIADCIEHLRSDDLRRIEAEPSAEDAWVDVVNGVANQTLYPQCNSWYLGANVPGKPRVFMPYIGFPDYVEKCNEVAARNYEGFHTTP
jgi:cyclohexanone monooxygenase